MQPPGGKPWLLYGLLGASLTMNLVMAIKWPREPAGEAARGGAEATAVELTAAQREPAPVAAEPAPAQPPPAALDDPGYRLIHAEVEKNLAHSFQQNLDEHADAVAAVFARQFVWDLDLRRDLQKGDGFTTLVHVEENGDIDMPLAFFHSQKLKRELKAYRFQAPGDAHPSFWYPDGTEVPLRLENGPLKDYIQITALLDDRRGHKGWDFKAAEGTPIASPRAGKVVRSNWSHAANGNCIDILQNDGVNAYYLHLSENLVKPGASVSAGQVIAKTGNTGHSTSPHLHYQLQRGERILDPADYHGTTRRRLPATAMPEFEKEMARLQAILGAQR